MTSVDFGRTAADYRKHRAGFPPALFERLATFGIARPGQDVLDLGTGTGSVARQLALRGATVTGIDPAAALLEEARLLDARANVAVDYRIGKAEATGFAGQSFDAVTAGQCWHWFDRARAAAEAYRILRPGGAVAIVYFDWLPLPGNVVVATERLIKRHNPAWQLDGGTGVHAEFFADLSGAGFANLESFSFDLDVPYSHEAWRGRIRASAGVAASLPPERVAAFDAEHATMLRESFPADPLAVPHRVWALVGRKAG